MFAIDVVKSRMGIHLRGQGVSSQSDRQTDRRFTCKCVQCVALEIIMNTTEYYVHR